MENVLKVKTIMIFVFGAVASWFGILFLPLVMMVISNVVDYATGIMASSARGEIISSYKSIKGIYKKVGMWVLVLISWMIDMLIDYSINTLGLQLGIAALASFTWPCAVACIMAVWVVCNEILSITENVRAMGTDVPEFADKITEGMLDNVEQMIVDKLTLKDESGRANPMEDDPK